jgi:hypothetical protein
MSLQAYSVSRSLERLPQALVAHDHGVDDAELIERVVVLPQDAHSSADESPIRAAVAVRLSAAS